MKLPGAPKLRLVSDISKPSIRDAMVTGADLDDDVIPTGSRRTRTNETPFAKVPLKWAAAVAEATGDPVVALAVSLAYLAWKAQSPTFTLSNRRLQRLGVTRWSKYRALERLEKAGLIRVGRTGKRAPVVTLLNFPGM
jgi:hypothetical protein